MSQFNDVAREWYTKGITLFVGKTDSTRRLAVDSQQTSFEENEQFRFFDRLVEVANANQVVYKVTVGNPVNVFRRAVNLWEGGREYLVFPDSANVTFTGSLTDVTSEIGEVNSNLREGLASHPVSTMQVQKAVGAGIFSSTDKPILGTGVLTDGNANRATNSYEDNGARAGIARNAVLWITLNPIGSVSSTNGQVELVYEERFND